MSRVFGVLRRVVRMIRTLSAPAVLALAGLGAALALAPPVAYDARDRFDEFNPNRRPDPPRGRLERLQVQVDSRGTPFSFDTWGSPERRLLSVTASSPVDTSRPYRPPREWQPFPTLLTWWSANSVGAWIGLEWIAAWAMGLTLLWGAWVWRAGRSRDGAVEERPPGRRPAWKRAAQPWVWAAAGLAMLCLSAPSLTGWPGDFSAGLTRDGDLPSFPRSLSVSWTRVPAPKVWSVTEVMSPGELADLFNPAPAAVGRGELGVHGPQGPAVRPLRRPTTGARPHPLAVDHHDPSVVAGRPVRAVDRGEPVAVAAARQRRGPRDDRNRARPGAGSLTVAVLQRFASPAGARRPGHQFVQHVPHGGPVGSRGEL